MGNENAQLAEFADNLWKNFIKRKTQEASADNVTFYRAKVVSNTNIADNKLTVQRPYDNTIEVSCVDSMNGAQAGEEVIVIRFGNGKNNANHLVVANGDGNQTHSLTWISPAGSTHTKVAGGFYREGKLAYVQWSITLTSALAQGTSVQISNFPIPKASAVALTAAISGKATALGCAVEAYGTPQTGRLTLTAVSGSVATTDTVLITGQYLID